MYETWQSIVEVFNATRELWESLEGVSTILAVLYTALVTCGGWRVGVWGWRLTRLMYRGTGRSLARWRANRASKQAAIEEEKVLQLATLVESLLAGKAQSRPIPVEAMILDRSGFNTGANG